MSKQSKGNFCGFFSPFIALVNTIRKPADIIRKSADSLIVFSNAIRISTLRVIASAEASSRQERAWHLS